MTSWKFHAVPWECCKAILFHTIEKFSGHATQSLYKQYMWHMMGCMHVIPLKIQWLSCSLIGWILSSMVLNVVQYYRTLSSIQDALLSIWYLTLERFFTLCLFVSWTITYMTVSNIFFCSLLLNLKQKRQKRREKEQKRVSFSNYFVAVGSGQSKMKLLKSVK